MNWLLIALLAGLSWFVLILYRTSRVLPPGELKKRARSGKDRQAASIYRLASYGGSLQFFLWLVGSISFGLMLLVATRIGWWLVVALVLAGVSGVIGWRSIRVGGALWKMTAFVSPPTTWLVSILHPLISPLTNRLNLNWPVRVHTGAYEKEDLLKIINAQNRQVDNRISESDLKIAFGALTFGDKTVGSVMIPRRAVKMVAASESTGPVLMDELYASGFSRFPVVRELSKSAAPQIIGTLYLRDLVGHGDTGKVKDLMKSEVYFINEAQTLRQALQAFLKTQHHLLVVVNNFEEIVGVLSIEDVLEQILGQKITDEFDQYSDLRAVAGLDAAKEHASRRGSSS